MWVVALQLLSNVMWYPRIGLDGNAWPSAVAEESVVAIRGEATLPLPPVEKYMGDKVPQYIPFAVKSLCGGRTWKDFPNSDNFSSSVSGLKVALLISMRANPFRRLMSPMGTSDLKGKIMPLATTAAKAGLAILGCGCSRADGCTTTLALSTACRSATDSVPSEDII